jgi:hypothetical protein
MHNREKSRKLLIGSNSFATVPIQQIEPIDQRIGLTGLKPLRQLRPLEREAMRTASP